MFGERVGWEAYSQVEYLMELNRPADAVALLGTLLAANPSDPRLLGQLGRGQLMLGQPAEAQRSIEQALAAAPDEEWLWMNLAWARVGQHRYRGAVKAASRAVGLAPNNPDAHVTFAWIGLRAEIGSRRIRAAIDRAIQLDPNSPAVWVVSGLKHELANEPRPARSDYERALRISPDDTDALLGLARTAPVVGEQVEMVRRSARSDLGDSRPMAEMRRHARTWIAVAAAMWSSWIPLVLAWVLGPALGVWAWLIGMVIWVGLILVAVRAVLDRTARRWASGVRTWWLFDGATLRDSSSWVARVRSVARRAVAVGVVVLTVLISIGLAAVRAEDARSSTQKRVLSDEPYELVFPDGSVQHRRVMVREGDPPNQSFTVRFPDGTSATAVVRQSEPAEPSLINRYSFPIAMLGAGFAVFGSRLLKAIR